MTTPSPPDAVTAPRAEGSKAPEQTTAPIATQTLLLIAFATITFLAIFLASFPSSNLDLWQHLADGRAFLRVEARPSPTWIYDVLAFGTFALGGGVLLAALKVALCGAVGASTYQFSRTAASAWLAIPVAGLAVLAMGTRMLLQPATVSLLFLMLTVWLLLREQSSDGEARVWPGWRFVVLFVVWANTDGRFVLGLGVVGLAWLGRLLDAPPPGGFWPALGRRVAALGVLVVASSLSPSHINGLRLPPELRAGVEALRDPTARGPQSVISPFERNYWLLFERNPAGLAYYPLAALSCLALLLNWKRCRWAWLLPWLGLAVASGLQARLIPFFAVVAGPLTAWSLHGYFAAHGAAVPARPRVRYAVLVLTGLLSAAFLIAAWPGWLQEPPYQPRRWVVLTPEAHRKGAEFLRRTHADGLWAKDSRTLHMSPDTAGTFAWFCPEDRGVIDGELVGGLLAPDDPERVRQRLRALGVTRVVAFEGEERNLRSLAVMDRLLTDRREWPVLHLTGGLVVFGWRDPARESAADPFAGREVDYQGLGFRPDESELAPGAHTPADRRWYDAFWKPAPPRETLGRNESALLLRQARAMIPMSLYEHGRAWAATQTAGLVGAAAPLAGTPNLADTSLRLALLNPPVPDDLPPGAPPPVVFLASAYQQEFLNERGRAPVGVLYAAVRAARRGLADNPADALAHFNLGRAYAALVRTSSEHRWARVVPEFMRLRQIQASAALNRAVALNPRLAEGHLELARLYLELGFLDLAAAHLSDYRDLPPFWNGPAEGDTLAEARVAELDRLTREVQTRTREFEAVASQFAVGDRAALAARRGLGGVARDLLLKSDLAAFGPEGMELELQLLLQTGRPEQVLKWTAGDRAEDAEINKGLLGEFSYHWLRAQAHVALGDYDEADREMDRLTGPGSTMATPEELGAAVAGLVGKILLDEQPGNPSASRALMSGIGRHDGHTQIEERAARLKPRIDVLVIRGLVAVEAGRIDRARDAFRAALRYAPDRGQAGGQLLFNGRTVARRALALLDDPELDPPGK